MEPCPEPPLQEPLRTSELERLLDCPLCAGGDLRRVYAREVECAAGRVLLELDLCEACGLMFRNPRPTAASLSAYYTDSHTASGGVWHESGSHTPRARLMDARVASLARATGSERATGRLLDVGSGSGDFLAKLELAGWSVAGLDPCPRAVNTARGLGFEVHQEALEDCTLAPASFDVVSSISCLEHVNDVRASVRAMTRLLAPEGLLFLEVPDSLRPVPQLAEFFSLEHLTHFTPGSLAHLLHAEGLEVSRFERPVDAPTLRVGARKGAQQRRTPSTATSVATELVELETSLQRYSRSRDELARRLGARLSRALERLERAGSTLAVYGAGEHTRALFDLLPLRERVTAVIDSDPSKAGGEFLDWTVRAPEELERLEVGAVLLSSQPFQEEMAARIAAPAARAGIEILRCYEHDAA